MICKNGDNLNTGRRSIRLKGYDYSQAGLYLVTICTQNRLHLFGKITVGADSISSQMILNDAGKMVNQIWLDIPNQHTNIQLHKHIIMPNHFHGIVEITVGADMESARETMDKRNGKWAEMDSAPTAAALSSVVQTFKRFTTVEYITMVKQNIVPRFEKRIWQRNYWEHIIRNENEYVHITDYIENNPEKWDNDQLNVGEPLPGNLNDM